MVEVPSEVWSLLGVVLGFTLGEGCRIIREKCRTRRLKHTIESELRTILAQIKDKKDILSQAVAALNNRAVLPMAAVRMITHGYYLHVEEIYKSYSDIERNCLHVIYERVRVADQHMESFQDDFMRAKKDGLLKDPWQAYVGHLEDIIDSYERVEQYIKGFIAGEPEDVFHTKARHQSP